ncbi:MAG TPA: hypothetical protein VGB77_21230, partial [Abditibacteriaceae bacterium]
AQQLRLKGATLSEKAEAELLLDLLMRQKAITSQTDGIDDYICEIGQPAIEPVMARLKEMQVNPKSYENTMGYSELFAAAAVLDGARALPILKHFEKYPGQWIPYYARMRHMRLEVELRWRKRLPPVGFYN